MARKRDKNEKPQFMATDYHPGNAVWEERPWAQHCPAHLSPGDQVWYIQFRPEWDQAARRWRLDEDFRDPCVIVAVPETIQYRGRSRRVGMYRLESLVTRSEFLTAGWTLDYVEPYHHQQYHHQRSATESSRECKIN